MLVNYSEPIPYEGDRPSTVEFAETEGGINVYWRITFHDGEVRTGFCGPDAKNVFYCKPDADLADLYYELEAADIHDCRALKATWPIWEARRLSEPKCDDEEA